MPRRSWLACAGAMLLATGLVRCGQSYSASNSGGLSGTDAGDDATSDSPASGDDAGLDATSAPGCPSGRGPAMVRIDVSGGPSFCIDATEVTESQYRAFLDSAPNPAQQPSLCSWNTSFTPDTVTFSHPNHPIVKTDWCDALAFCTWAGKRLCGNVADGGGLLSGDDSIDPFKDEWMVACTRLGTRDYPYGPTFQNGACNDTSVDASAAVDVASLPACQGGYDGIFDMGGNVTEWENACDDVDGGGRVCKNRGGSWVVEGHCAYSSSDDWTGTSSDWGVRCCASVR